ncbi:MAG: cell surface protein SprA, partial [Bacteroidetes bacterium]|nr:cell surface protein SprA [Bacteroidota bacterium]
LDNAPDAATRDAIEEQSINYTKRQSINFIGVRKNRSQENESTPMPYDVENFTFSYSYNEEEHHDFEVESAMDQRVRLGGTYDYSFNNKPIEPFKKNDSLFMGRYWQWLKDFNFNPLPSNVTVSSNIIRNFNQQKFRELNLLPDQIGLPTLYQRNFMFDWQYTINYNLTNSLRFNFNAANNRIINNYIDQGRVDNTIGLWDGFFEIGDPNQHVQSLQLNYDLPTAKFPFLKWLRATYSYQGDYQWQDGSDLFSNVEIPSDNGPSVFYDLGNSVQNASTHRINSNLDLTSLYRYIGLKKLTGSESEDDQGGAESNSLLGGAAGKGGKAENLNKREQIMAMRDGGGRTSAPTRKLSPGQKVINSLIGLATSVKKAQVTYVENNGIFLPGYLPSVGFGGSLRPTAGFVFGSQAEVRALAARNGWLTIFPEFNQQYTEVESRQLDMQVNTELFDDLKIDFNASRLYSENFAENYIVEDGLYRSLTPNTFGNFNISTVLINTAFSSSDEFGSQAFESFKTNRLTIAQRLAERFYGSNSYPVDDEGYPEGFGKNSQQVLLPAFVSAYRGSDAAKERSGIFRDIPLPNWDVKYTGFMKMDWFKKRFKRFSVQHGYRAAYTLNQFQSNLDFNRQNPAETDQSGNFKPEIVLNNVNLTEQFSPLIKVDFEMMNSIKILAEIRKDRALSLSFANNLMTEIQGQELILGLGYRIKDLRIGTNFGGKRSVMKSDLNFKLDVSVRDNKTIIRYLDVDNNQTTAGQTIYGLQFSTDYALTKNLTALFFYDHTFSEYAISTAFPQTTIRSGFTLRYNFGN